MASLIKQIAEYENKYGMNNENTETVIEIRMSKANAAKFAKIIENGGEIDGNVYTTPCTMIDENTVEFANGWTGEDFDGIFCDETDEIIGDYRWVK